MSLSRALLFILGALVLLGAASYVVPVVILIAVSLWSGEDKQGFERANGSSWVGRKMGDVTHFYGPTNGTLITRDNKKEYIHDYRSGYGPCLLFWTVDQNDVVTAWHHEGRGCTQSWSL